VTSDDDVEFDAFRKGSARMNVENSDYGTGKIASVEPTRSQHTVEATEHPKVLE
jgi:hypothetical protein